MNARAGTVARKALAVALLAASVALSVAVSLRMKALGAELGAVCVHDTLRAALNDWLLPYMQNVHVLNAMMILDALMIDLMLVFVGGRWVLDGHSLSWLCALAPFYVIRAVVLNVSKWPLPTPYLFVYPDFPSFFVSYKKTNDLFFSGHTGMSVIMLLDAWFNRRLVLFLVSNVLLGLTVTMLFVTGAHYVNDILVGFMVGASCATLAFEHRFRLALLAQRALLAAERRCLKAFKFFKQTS